jgi:hypothetical protein
MFRFFEYDMWDSGDGDEIEYVDATKIVASDEASRRSALTAYLGHSEAEECQISDGLIEVVFVHSGRPIGEWRAE